MLSIVPHPRCVRIIGFPSIGYQITHQFDAVGNLTNRILAGTSGFANQLRSEYKLDVMNWLTNLTATVDGALSSTAAYHYNATGRLDRKTYGNGDLATKETFQRSHIISGVLRPTLSVAGRRSRRLNRRPFPAIFAMCSR